MAKAEVIDLTKTSSDTEANEVARTGITRKRKAHISHHGKRSKPKSSASASRLPLANIGSPGKRSASTSTTKARTMSTAVVKTTTAVPVASFTGRKTWATHFPATGPSSSSSIPLPATTLPTIVKQQRTSTEQEKKAACEELLTLKKTLAVLEAESSDRGKGSSATSRMVFYRNRCRELQLIIDGLTPIDALDASIRLAPTLVDTRGSMIRTALRNQIFANIFPRVPHNSANAYTVLKLLLQKLSSLPNGSDVIRRFVIHFLKGPNAHLAISPHRIAILNQRWILSELNLSSFVQSTRREPKQKWIARPLQERIMENVSGSEFLQATHDAGLGVRGLLDTLKTDGALILDWEGPILHGDARECNTIGVRRTDSGTHVTFSHINVGCENARAKSVARIVSKYSSELKSITYVSLQAAGTELVQLLEIKGSRGKNGLPNLRNLVVWGGANGDERCTYSLLQFAGLVAKGPFDEATTVLSRAVCKFDLLDGRSISFVDPCWAYREIVRSYPRVNLENYKLATVATNLWVSSADFEPHYGQSESDLQDYELINSGFEPKLAKKIRKNHTDMYHTTDCLKTWIDIHDHHLKNLKPLFSDAVPSLLKSRRAVRRTEDSDSEGSAVEGDAEEAEEEEEDEEQEADDLDGSEQRGEGEEDSDATGDGQADEDEEVDIGWIFRRPTPEEITEITGIINTACI